MSLFLLLLLLLPPLPLSLKRLVFRLFPISWRITRIERSSFVVRRSFAFSYYIIIDSSLLLRVLKRQAQSIELSFSFHSPYHPLGLLLLLYERCTQEEEEEEEENGFSYSSSLFLVVIKRKVGGYMHVENIQTRMAIFDRRLQQHQHQLESNERKEEIWKQKQEKIAAVGHWSHYKGGGTWKGEGQLSSAHSHPRHRGTWDVLLFGRRHLIASSEGMKK